MSHEFEALQKSADFLKSQTDFRPELVLTLGSGLGAFAEELAVVCSVDYAEIPGFVPSTVEGHCGKLIFGTLKGKKLALMQGRVHLYEGYSAREAVRPLRTLRLLGAETLFLTNAAGGINPNFSTGDLMLITDHVVSFAESPLRGENVSELGPRFPDMSRIYSPELCATVKDAAQALSIPLQEGVYLQTAGPQFETPAEIRAFAALGADAVGMSTAVEAVAARHAGMRVVGISCISNLAAGLSPTPLTHEEVQEAGRACREKFTALVTESIRRF